MGYMTRDCHEGTKGGVNVEINSAAIVPTKRQAEKLSVILNEESRLPLKDGTVCFKI